MFTDAYLESKVLSASPIELVQMLYEKAIDSLQQARACLANGEIAARSAAISKCLDILVELSASLNHQDGGELSTNLLRLYNYMQQRLLEANIRQAEEPLAETLGLLKTLSEAWHSIKAGAESNIPQVPVWTNPFEDAASRSGSAGWTL